VGSAPVKTDVVRAFVDAFRKAGLKVGLCYSVLDYHHGVVNGGVTRAEIEFTKAQLTELLTNYGPIDYMNFDDIPYAELYRAVKAIQPDCLIVNHCYESGSTGGLDTGFEDHSGGQSCALARLGLPVGGRNVPGT
jgi:alpha-L-fucosidase